MDEDGIPADKSHEHHEFEQDGSVAVAEIDLETGEVKELVTAV